MKTFISLLLCASLFACKREKPALTLSTEKEEITISPEQASISDDQSGGYNIFVSAVEPAVNLEIGKQPSGSGLRVNCTYNHQEYTLSHNGNLSNNITVDNDKHRYRVSSELNLEAVNTHELLKIKLTLPNVRKK